MPLESPSASTLNTITQVHRAYMSLMAIARPSGDHSLNGLLLYAGELDTQGCLFATAANIAGAATLAVSSDSTALRRALHEGVLDFLVNSLDEALRILKNEIRKRQPVAVAVSIDPETVENEMLERGVLPDLLAVQSISKHETIAYSAFTAGGAITISPSATETQSALHIWAVPAQFAQNLAAFEQLLASQTPDDELNRRWICLSPRYLGSAARKFRSIACDDRAARELSIKLGAPLKV